jgi:hypothetical protein
MILWTDSYRDDCLYREYNGWEHHACFYCSRIGSRLYKKKKHTSTLLACGSFERMPRLLHEPVLDLHYYLPQMLPVLTYLLMLIKASCWLLFRSCFQIWKMFFTFDLTSGHGCLWNEARIRYCGHCFFIPLLVRIRDLDKSFLLCIDYTFSCLKLYQSL